MHLERFLADFVSTLVNDSGRGDVETRCLVSHIPASTHARSSTRSSRKQPGSIASPTSRGWPTSIFLYQLYHHPDLPVVQQRKPNRTVLKDLGQRKGID